jgi:hypothetical protein
MKKAFFALALIFLSTASVFAQGDENIKEFLDAKYCDDDTLTQRR